MNRFIRVNPLLLISIYGNFPIGLLWDVNDYQILEVVTPHNESICRGINSC